VGGPLGNASLPCATTTKIWSWKTRKEKTKKTKTNKAWRSGAGRGVSDLFPEYLNFNFSILQFSNFFNPQPPNLQYSIYFLLILLILLLVSDDDDGGDDDDGEDRAEA